MQFKWIICDDQCATLKVIHAWIEWIRFHECLLSQFPEFVKLILLVSHHQMQHPIINLNHPLTTKARRHKHTTFTGFYCVWFGGIFYCICSWKKCRNTLSIWHHMCLSARKRNHESRRTRNQTIKQTGELAKQTKSGNMGGQKWWKGIKIM